jgi:hypothetical protein
MFAILLCGLGRQAFANLACTQSYKTDRQILDEANQMLDRFGTASEDNFNSDIASAITKAKALVRETLARAQSMDPSRIEKMLFLVGRLSMHGTISSKENSDLFQFLENSAILDIAVKAPINRKFLDLAKKHHRSIGMVSSDVETGFKLKSFLKAIAFTKKYYSDESQFVEEVTNSAREALLFDSTLDSGPRLPDYNLFKMTKENVRHYFGIPSRVVQDVTIASSFFDGTREVVAFSNRPIDGQPENNSGIYFKTLASIPGESLKSDQTVSWQIEGKVLTARVQLEPVTEKVAPSRESSFRYAEMEKDGKVGSLIMISNNLSDFTGELGKYYIEHFKRRGMKVVEKRNLSFEEALALIQDNAQKGHYDFALREGHSEFSPDVMISLSEQVQLVRMQSNKAGLMREVTLILPVEASSATMFAETAPTISYAQLGDALRASPRRGDQFVFVDTSCFGLDAVQRLVEMVATPGFVPLASKHELETFTPEKGTTIYELLMGMEGQLSHDQITKKTKPDARLSFPNHEDYLSADAEASLRPYILHVERNFNPMTDPR